MKGLEHMLLSFLLVFKKIYLAQCWWCTPVTLVTCETEIGRIEVQGQPVQIIGKTASSM
jgi:hypothetical protein